MSQNRRRYLVALSLVLAFSAQLVTTLGCSEAEAQTSSQGNLLLFLRRLNGTPVRVGVLTTASLASVSTTISTVYPTAIECPDNAAHVGLQGTCSATPTSVNYCMKVNAAPDRMYMMPTSTSTTTISMFPAHLPLDGGSASCPVFEMR